ncbi:MAG: PAS domain S-box protein, partial [Spirochaetota bacterium]|nr:PAS domain S-box protein [Spirochaetota bacterium]
MDERILLVEDEPFIAREEVRVLEQHGYQVTAVPSGERAVETVSNNSRFSLILMDIDLGTGIDGAETARRILTRRSVPVLFLTCHKEFEFVERVKDIPSYGYILKDAGEYVLIESVRSAFNLFRSSDGVCTREYERIVENTNELISEVDENDNIVFVNSQYADILGYSPDELIGKPVEILVRPEDLPQATERYHAIRAEVSSTLEVVRFRHKNGSYRTFECRGTVYVNNSGEKSTIIFSRDITEQEKAEQALRTSEARFAAFMDHFPGAAFI